MSRMSRELNMLVRWMDDVLIFEDKRIRRSFIDGEWFFSVVDVIAILTKSSVPKRYWSDLKIKLNQEGFQSYDFIVQLKMRSNDGKRYMTDCANLKGIFRIIQSIPSKRVEPFKLWLAKVGSERIDEIRDPELAQNRARKYYEEKGYPDDWIEKRLRGVAIRQDLTGEWEDRGIEKKREYAILTNEISKATFDKNIEEHREIKGLGKGKENLRDYMTDWELILTMIGEKATTDISVAKDSEGFDECLDSAVEGGDIAGNTRREIERKTSGEIVTKENFIGKKKEKKKRRQPIYE